MLLENKIRALLNAGKPSVNTRIWSTWPTTCELAAESGNLDYIEFLAEYVPFTFPQLENIVRTCELHNLGSMIKVDFLNRGYVAQKALALGFQAILFTDHRTPEEVRHTLTMVTPECPEDGGLFGYPNGRWLGYNPEKRQMDYAAMNRSAVKAFMIEKKEAVDNIEQICAIPGVDMVQFGPSDYCMSRGWDVCEHRAQVKDIERHVIEVALKHGVQPRCEVFTIEQAEQYKQLGVRHFCMGDEFDILREYWTNVGAAARKMAEGI